MDMYEVLTDKEKTKSVIFLAEETHRISEHVAGFVRRLANVCEVPDTKSRWKASISLAEDKVTATIDSPLGGASGELRFVINDDNQVEGRWVIRKHVSDRDGSPVRVKVTSLRVLENGLVFFGLTQQHGVRATTRFISDEDSDAYTAMSAILYILGRSED